MLILWILAAVLISLLLLLLFAPVRLRVNSQERLAELSALLVVKGAVVMEDHTIWLRLRVFGFTRKWDLLKLAAEKREPSKAKKKKSPRVGGESKKERGNFPPLRKIIGVVKSFRVHELVLRIDTGDYALNGFLFPLFYWLSRWSGKTIEINFLDRNELILDVSNTPARALYAFIRS